jgi:alkanesulfonate monooxygenase SsuD/methylene tetrahydromethanopterin reductase-like flavin-dependent oxidoreductase (luciferase family)
MLVWSERSEQSDRGQLEARDRVTVPLGIALPLAGQGHDPARFVDELMREARAADAAGFDLCLVPEHHRGPPVSIVAPLTLCAAIAAVTDRIRVGPGVLILPVHEPLHVAEQVTMVDQLSAGRAVVGVGAGYQQEDFEPFGIDPGTRGARFERALEQLGGLLTAGALSPAPVQRPRPPIWVGAWSKVGVQRAARLADGWIADPIRTVDEVAVMATRYREALEGRHGAVVVMREAWVDDGHGALDRFARVIAPVFRYYRRHGAGGDIPEAFTDLARGRFVIGSPAACLDQVEEVAARTGADAVVLSLRHPGGPEHADVLEAIAGLGAARKAPA